MNYEEAKAFQNELEMKNKSDGAKLKAFDQYRNEMGLVPDHIRESSEYQILKQEFNKSFTALRNFNGWYVKQFKKELLAERRNRYPKKSIAN